MKHNPGEQVKALLQTTGPTSNGRLYSDAALGSLARLLAEHGGSIWVNAQKAGTSIADDFAGLTSLESVMGKVQNGWRDDRGVWVAFQLLATPRAGQIVAAETPVYPSIDAEGVVEAINEGNDGVAVKSIDRVCSIILVPEHADDLIPAVELKPCHLPEIVIEDGDEHYVGPSELLTHRVTVEAGGTLVVDEGVLTRVYMDIDPAGRMICRARDDG